jgi:hypothetical protein
MTIAAELLTGLSIAYRISTVRISTEFLIDTRAITQKNTDRNLKKILNNRFY